MTFCSLLLAMVVGISETCSTSGVVRVDGAYAESVRRAGDVPVVICRTATDADLDQVLGSVDLLLLPGGEDVEPARYGEAPTPGMGPVNPVRDDFEFRLLRAAVRRELPVVGICRGCQVVNVFFGGSLYQDLPTELPASTVVHRDRSSKKATQALRHPVTLEEGSRLAGIFGTNRVFSVNSIHHQAVKKVAPGFRVAARTADGVVEAIESDRYPAAGVQFHPEKLVANHGDKTWELFFRNLKAFAGRAGVGDGLNGDRVDFDVALDGRALPVEPARDSAFPLNQVWPGYERPISQSRLDAFVRFDLARPGTLEVKVPAGVKDGEVKLRPYGRAEILQVRDGVARVRLEKPQQAVLEFGAGRPQLHVFADPPFTHRAVPNEIYFGPGVHEAGLICPTNGQTVCLDAGATVYGALLLEGVTNVTVTGRGILDSSRIRRTHSDGQYLRRLSAEEKAKLVDVTAFMCRASENVRVEGVVFRDAPFWVLIFREGCRRVVVDNVKVVGQWRYNSDGIDICGCRDVVVRNSFIRSFDDSFVVRDDWKGGAEGAARNIVCEDCLLWCDWGCNVKAQLSFVDGATIEQVAVRRCVFANVQAMGVIVAARPGGRGGLVRDVAVEDVELDLSDVRLKQRLQHREKPDEAYVPEAQSNLVLFVVNNYDLRNRPLDRISLLYDRLAFRRFKVLGGPYESAIGKVQLTAGKEEVRDFVADDLPPRFFLSKKATFTTSAAGR